MLTSLPGTTMTFAHFLVADKPLNVFIRHGEFADLVAGRIDGATEIRPRNLPLTWTTISIVSCSSADSSKVGQVH